MKKSASVLMSILVLFLNQAYGQESEDVDALLSESQSLRYELNQLIEADDRRLDEKELNLVTKEIMESKKSDEEFSFDEAIDQETNFSEAIDFTSENEVFSGTDCIIFDYQMGEVKDVCLKPGFVTDIVMPIGEEVKKITLGNDMLFDVKTYASFSGDGSWHIYVNPIKKNIETNMIISTDVRNYYLQLVSGEIYFPFVKWKVNDKMVIRNGKRVNPSELLTMEVDSIKDLHFNYASSPKKKYKWAPINVFDDRYWNTYLVFETGRLNSIDPLVFSEKEDGSLEVISYKKVEDTIVIKKVCSDFLVKVGDSYVKYHRKS